MKEFFAKKQLGPVAEAQRQSFSGLICYEQG